MYALFVRMTVKPASLETIWREIGEVARRVRTEEGCIMFEPFRPVDGSPVVMILEKWTERAKMQAHEALPYMKDLYARLGDMLDGKPELTDITVFEG